MTLNEYIEQKTGLGNSGLRVIPLEDSAGCVLNYGTKELVRFSYEHCTNYREDVLFVVDAIVKALGMAL